MHARVLTILAVCMSLAWQHAVRAQVSIRDVRATLPGSVVTTTGTVTTGAEWGWQRYFQDAEAGIAAYGSTLAGLQPGDSIRIRGVVSSYRGEIQLSPVLSVDVLASGRPIRARLARDIRMVQDSGWQAMRVRFSCAGFQSCYDAVREGPMRLFDRKGNYLRVEVPSEFPGVDHPLGLDMFAEGVAGTLVDQLVLRLRDIGFNESGICDLIPPASMYQSGLNALASWLDPAGMPLYVEWKHADTTILLFPYWAGDIVGINVPVEQAGDVHAFRLKSAVGPGDTICSPWSLLAISATDAPAPEFYFNRTLDDAFSDGSMAAGVGSSVIETDIIRRIDEAVATLDVAMYNTNRESIVQALRRASSRGVQIRYIADSETSNNALSGSQPFPVLYRTGDGIMHHKFVIGDADDSARAWVWAGSTNFSVNQLTQDPNHAIVLRDQAAARIYTMEFNELWGTLPGNQDSRSGDLKVDDTPHAIMLGGAPVEMYFSPSDETGCHILRAIESADHQILAGLLLLTRDELIEALIHRHEAGLDVRVIVDDEDSSEEALYRLRSAGVPVRVHRFSPIFHHKYAIIDEGTDSDPVVVTGSHNWTFSADRINDENVLIFRDQTAANVFRQEFEARWAELAITAADYPMAAVRPEVYPNPATTVIHITNPWPEPCQVIVSDLTGRQLVVDELPLLSRTTMTIPEMPGQLLTVTWQSASGRHTSLLQVIR